MWTLVWPSLDAPPKDARTSRRMNGRGCLSFVNEKCAYVGVERHLVSSRYPVRSVIVRAPPRVSFHYERKDPPGSSASTSVHLIWEMPPNTKRLVERQSGRLESWIWTNFAFDFRRQLGRRAPKDPEHVLCLGHRRSRVEALRRPEQRRTGIRQPAASFAHELMHVQ